MLVAVVVVGIVPSAFAQSRAAALRPASWTPLNDSAGFIWDIQQQGHVNRGTNNAFSSGMVLTVNGSGFSSTQQNMTSDGREFILVGRANNIAVSRRIRVDPKGSGARWVDSFTNPTAAPLSVQIMYQTSLNNQSQVVTERGGALGPTLSEKDRGFMAIQMQNNYPSVMMTLVGGRAKVRPTINNQSNYRFKVQYQLTIPAGETRSLITGLAQSNIRTPPTNQKARDAMFKPFTSRKFLRDIPRDVMRTVVNWSGGGGFVSGERPAIWTLPDDLDVEPIGADVLAIGEATRLKGKVSWDKLAIESAHGEVTLAVEQVAAIAGPRYLGGHSRVYLRDGQIVAGKLAAEKLSFKMTAGNAVAIDPTRVDRIVLGAKPDDGKMDPAAVAMVDTFAGDRLALGKASRLNLAAITPWGTRQLQLDSLRWLAVRAEERAGYEVVLDDGSRFFTLFDSNSVKLHSNLFGSIDVPATRIRYLTTEATPKSNDEDAPEIDQPYVLVEGDQIIVGTIDQPELPLMTPAGLIPLKPGQVRSLKRDSSDVKAGQPVTFIAELWDEGTASGTIDARALPVRVGDQVWQIPPSSIVEIVSPKPQLSDEQRAQIVNLIRTLGDPEWSKREAATTALGELGALAEPLLSQALRHTRDPEVRQRVEQLLENAP